MQSDERFEKRWHASIPIFERYLTKLGQAPDSIPDVLQTAFTKIWPRRHELSFEDDGRWLAYLKCVFDSVRHDHGAKDGRETPVQPDKVLVADTTFTEAIQARLDEREATEASQDLWLGEAPDELPTKTLAAMLLLLDGRRPSELAQISQFSRQSFSLRAAVSVPRVQRQVMYEVLKPPHDQVACAVLGLPVDHLAEAVTSSAAGRDHCSETGKWRATETHIAIRHCLEYEPASIISRSIPEMQLNDIAKVIVRIQTLLPFSSAVQTILQGMARYRLDHKSLGESGLWKLVAFQYTLESQTHQDLLAWMSGPAHQCGFSLGPMQVHGWISNKRLLRELQANIEERRRRDWPS